MPICRHIDLHAEKQHIYQTYIGLPGVSVSVSTALMALGRRGWLVGASAINAVRVSLKNSSAVRSVSRRKDRRRLSVTHTHSSIASLERMEAG